MALNFWGKQNLLRNAMTAPPKYAYKTSNTVKRFAQLQKTPSKKIQAGMLHTCTQVTYLHTSQMKFWLLQLISWVTLYKLSLIMGIII